MEFFENLDDLESCPPSTAKEPCNMIVYRFVENCPPLLKDFYSLRKLKGIVGGFFKDVVSECDMRCCSVFSDILVAKRKWRPKPGGNVKFVNMRLIKIRLNEQDGLLRQDPGSHCSWWISSQFDPSVIDYTEVLYD